MKIEIGITWFPRKVETFHQSQATINHDNVTIYPDGVEFPHRTDFTVKTLGDHRGCFKHYYRTLEDLCKTDADVVASLCGSGFAIPSPADWHLGWVMVFAGSCRC